MERHINYQLIDKISRNRRDNRNEIKRLIAKKEFYYINLDIPVIDKLVGDIDYRITRDYRFFIENGEFESNPVLLLRYKDINSRSIEASKIIGNLSSSLELITLVGKLSYDKPIVIYIEKENIKVPVVNISVIEKSNKFKIDYSEFNPVRNYPDYQDYKNQKDLILSKIISPYYFTGYDFKVEYIIYDKDLRNELDRKEIKLSLTDKSIESSARLLVTDKFCSWKFKKDYY